MNICTPVREDADHLEALADLIRKGRPGIGVRAHFARLALAANPSLFADAPHPSARRANAGDTERDYILWVLAQPGKPVTTRLVCDRVWAAWNGQPYLMPAYGRR